ncbi:MAG: ribosome recycling factor, partial [Bacteroidetes bacterium]
MSEELDIIIDSVEESMKKAIHFFEGELVKIRAGKASPDMLNGIMAEYYGAPTPISQIA